MIAVDTSALMAILLDEPEAGACMTALQDEADIILSAGTMAEALIVAARRNVATEMERLIDVLGLQIVTLTEAAARRVASAYARWGKGMHPAGLNFGDCFAYEVATAHDCRLLFVGDDFARTDVARAI
ncbi:ribonuclease VapC [Bradyrhizobium sp. USDA 4369]